MKISLFFSFLLCFCASAFGDVTVIHSPILGTAVQGPDGSLQIIHPIINLGGWGSYSFNGDPVTAKIVCSYLNKNLVSHQAVYEDYYTQTVKFDETGALSFVYRVKYEKMNIMKTVSCK